MEVEWAAVDLGGEVGGGRVGVYLRGGDVEEILSGQLNPHDTAMDDDILRHVMIAGLHEFLGYDRPAGGLREAGQPAGGLGFTDVRADAGDENGIREIYHANMGYSFINSLT